MKGTIFWRFLCFFIEENIVILWDEMGGSGRIWDLCREKRAISTDKQYIVVSRVQIESSTNQHGDFTSDDAYIDGMCVSTAVIVILLWFCVLWDGGPGWPAQYPQPTGATRGQGRTISG